MKPLIDPETIKKNAYLPVKLSELSKENPEAALKLLQDWGDGKKTIKKLWEETLNLLENVVA
jgi:DNA polymerase/3'-5' exonuclease PolX